ncbi:MAG TPA: DUF1254 domain-containing protein [Methylobacter sp.]|jgi:hypothetical protein
MAEHSTTEDGSDFSLDLPQRTVSPTSEWEEEYAYSLGIQAYIYGFPWIYNAQLRWLWASLGGKKLSEKKNLPDLYAPINSFHHAEKLASPANQTGGSPNCDTLYSTAWLELGDDPIVLSVPAVTDRFYCIEMVCMDADNFAYVGTRSTGVEAGNFLIAGPFWNGQLPEGVSGVLPRSRTATVLLMGRTGVNNTSQEDLDKANAIQEQYLLTPLSDWPNTPSPQPTHVMVPYGVDYNHTAGAWQTMNKAMTENPPGLSPGINQEQMLKLFATIGIGPNQDLDAQSDATRTGLQRAAKDGLAMLKKMTKGRGKTVNGWTYPPTDIGRAGQNSDFITRAALQSLAGICANDPAEAVYINVFTDNEDIALSGQYKYSLTFKAGEFPPYDTTKHGFWSVTVYNSTYNLVPNSTSYSINSYYPEYQGRDSSGGITILIQSEQPEELPEGTYWLQSPNGTDNDTFFLFLRVYVPDPSVSVTQSWVPPQIVRATA